MYFKTLVFKGAFPDGDKWVEVSCPNGGGGSTVFSLSVDKYYWGQIIKYYNGWQVRFQNENPDYSAGDLQPLIDLILGN